MLKDKKKKILKRSYAITKKLLILLNKILI